MNKSVNFLTVDECKIQASILLKSLRSQDTLTWSKAAKRFGRLPEFKDISPELIFHSTIKRKHALAVIALENGFKSWADLKCQLPFIRGGFLNSWFAHYPQAKAYQQAHGGYLLPFKNQFFICTDDYINELGLNALDHDWELIGYDWANPDNKNAWQRLYKKWITIQKKDR